MEEELELEAVVVEAEDVARGGGLAGAVRRGAGAAAAAARPLSVVASECGLEEVGALPPSVAHCTCVLALDGNRLRDLEGLVPEAPGAPPLPALQELRVGGNRLTAVPGPRVLGGMPSLVALDLSFNEALTLRAGCFTGLRGLWRLDLSGCGLESLRVASSGSGSDSGSDAGGGGAEEEEGQESSSVDGEGASGNPFAELLSLRELDLSDNEIEEVDDLAPLKALPLLEKLNLQDCPVCETRHYKKRVLELLPALQNLDHDGTGAPRGDRYAAARGAALAYQGSGAEAVFGANLDRSSCSCVEGNPCVDPDPCLDWKNRFTVAMKARWAKGMRGAEH